MKSRTTEEILRLAGQFMESRVLLAAAELDIFTMLARSPLSASEVAMRSKMTGRGTTILLNALVAMGLLEKEGEKFRCPPALTPVLTKDTPDSILPMILHMATLWGRWSDLTEIVRNGADSLKPVTSMTGHDQEAFIGAMHVVGARLAREIVTAVEPGHAERLLDVGGGSGTYVQAFLEACQNMSATIFDLSQVIEMARRRLGYAGLLDRVRLVPGSFYEDELPMGHDLVLLSAIIHMNSHDQNLELYRKIWRALEPGGRLVIRDHVMNPDHTQPTGGTLFAVNMLVATKGGDCYSLEEITGALSKAGFVKIRSLRAGENMDCLVEAIKPEYPK